MVKMVDTSAFFVFFSVRGEFSELEGIPEKGVK